MRKMCVKFLSACIFHLDLVQYTVHTHTHTHTSCINKSPKHLRRIKKRGRKKKHRGRVKQRLLQRECLSSNVFEVPSPIKSAW